ncbi:MAG: phosphoethanolamine--lipid A transferase [Pseudomonadota bacterium]
MTFSTLRRIDARLLTLSATAFILLFDNLNFWKSFVYATGGLGLRTVPLLLGTFAVIFLVFNAFLTLVNFRFVIKPVLIVLFVLTAATSYFMGTYGTQIDKSMVQNLFETDLLEARELLNVQLLFTVLLLGVLPALAVAYTEPTFPRLRRDLVGKATTVGVSLIVAAAVLLIFFKSLAPAIREHRELRFLLTPTNYIQAVNGYLRQMLTLPLVVAPLGTDAIKGKRWAGTRRRTVTIMVVGETARADNFSLNGYARETNPLLSRQHDLINFSRMQSCGTATAVSVPCVFSALGREHYTDRKARSQQGLLDVIAHAGFSVLWRDNNSGCKGVCDRVAHENWAAPEAGDPLCDGDECYDERMLTNLPELIRNGAQDMLIVLHQKGSHGPAYWRRYPAAFKHFGPVCETNELDQCSRESIVAAYDNTIRYTDYFLSKTIDTLRQSAAQDDVDTALLYFSDHGESLGENNMYLHGAPYFIAPSEQRHVPFMLWLSAGFRTRFAIDETCLAARRAQQFSHDNVFHSVLGMLNINTAVYNPALDIFHACSNGH